MAPFHTGPRVLVIGCGGIGGIIAARLAQQDFDVSVLTTNAAIANAVQEAGLRVRVSGHVQAAKPAAVLEVLDDSVQPFDYILLATPPTQVERAARDSFAWLERGGRAVCFQNGLCEQRVAAIVGAERVVGAVVAWGASMLEPGVYERTSTGGFTVGTLHGRIDTALDEVRRLLGPVGPVSFTQNLLGVRYSKLALNCAISTLGTIGGARLGPLLQRSFVRRLGLEILSEVVCVAHAEGVRLERVTGTVDLEWLVLTPDERAGKRTPALIAKHSVMLAVGARYRRLRSSMLAAIERGRMPSIEYLNGEIVTRGELRGVDVPVNRAARALVWDIAEDKEKASRQTLRRLYQRTRS
jgi:2-dehydropantoate 2-reductase